ncbi:MAG: AMP-binding protein [Bacteroidales bacterium]|nr:AMP-binding protein [Bacteroidales bacterium]MBR4408799.1 AMP-binding protein [Bacteroidales bacterium]MBR5955290.1 AMP-binding protein [Bacteroidales bacterium]
MEIKSLNKAFQKSFIENWDRPALSNYQGATLFYRDVARRIAKLHIAFEQCGLQKGDKVAICSRNQANWGVSYLAALTYGAVAVPILHEFKPGNVHYLVNHSEAKVLFVDEVVWEGLTADEMPDLQVVVQINTFKFLYTKFEALWLVREHLNESFGRRYPNNFGPEDLDYYEDSPEEMAMINYTSGTSGFSKGVMIPYRALTSNVEFALQAEPHINNKSDVVAMLPSAHMYGMMFEFLFEMVVGAHVHFLTRVPSPKIILQAFSEIHPNIIVAVPLIIEKIYRSKLKPILDKNKIFFKIPILDKVLQKKILGELKNSFGNKFEEVIIGGAAFNPEVESFFKKIDFPYTVGYGMTECAPIITYAHWNKAKLYSCGKAALHMEVKIDSPDPQNIPGEVLTKGPNVFLGYYKNPEATAAVMTEDGWLRTGDMGIMDKDGYLFLRGRSKCMILGPSGQNIYPEEIEAVINNVTYVVDSLVIEDNGGLTALIYPDYHQAELDGMSRSDLEKRLRDALPEINKEVPNYAKIKDIEFMPEDFERTPKRSIKRYLYQRN